MYTCSNIFILFTFATLELRITIIVKHSKGFYLMMMYNKSYFNRLPSELVIVRRSMVCWCSDACWCEVYSKILSFIWKNKLFRKKNLVKFGDIF